MQAVIHIGAPKAGSSSIQEFLFSNRKALASRGFRYHRNVSSRISQYEYPMAALSRHGQLLGNETQRIRYNARTLDEQRRTSERHVRRLPGFARKWKEPTALFSSEHILPWLKPPGTIKTFDRMFTDAFDDARYVVYFRSPFEAIVSQYSEQIKRAGTSATLDEFIDMRLGALNLFQPANRWRQAVGADRLDVRLLDRRLLKSGDLIEDYCDLCGIDSSGLIRPEQANRALSAPAAECLRIMNARIPEICPEGGHNPLRAKFLEHLEEISADAPKLSLTPAQRQKIHDALAPSNERFRKAFFPEADAPFAWKEPEPAVLADAELREMAMQLMTELLIRSKLGRIPRLPRWKRRKATASTFELLNP